MKGPEFHYECNKNTTLHKNSDHWGATMQYRDDLLEASREFAANMRSPVPALEWDVFCQFDILQLGAY